MEANQEKIDEGSPPQIPVNPSEKQSEPTEQISLTEPVPNVDQEIQNADQTNDSTNEHKQMDTIADLIEEQPKSS